MFTVGDKVLYPMHGAAVIRDVEQKVIDGRQIDYFVFDMLLSNMKVMVPAGNVERWAFVLLWISPLCPRLKRFSRLVLKIG